MEVAQRKACETPRWKRMCYVRRCSQVYGLDEEMVAAVFTESAGRCAVCNSLFTCDPDSVVIDHDHKTMTVRGLLCGRCNRALGAFADDRGLLVAAARYLGSPPHWIPIPESCTQKFGKSPGLYRRTAPA